MPCFLPVGLKWPPAEVNGGSHLAVWWMWMACSPGGRFLASSLIVTPLPPLFSVMVAVPTLWPLASARFTLTLLAAESAAALRTAAIAIAMGCLLIVGISFREVTPSV